MTAPVASSGTAMGYRTGMGCCWVRGRLPIGLRLEGLVASALPAVGAIAVSGSMLLGRPSGSPPFVVHVKPVAVPQPDYGARHVAALVLIVEPESQHRIDPGMVATTLGLTPMESRVAVWLAEGKSVRDMAEATGRTQGSIYWHLKQIYQKQSDLPAGGPGAAGAVDRRVRVTAALPEISVGRPGSRPLPFSSKSKLPIW